MSASPADVTPGRTPNGTAPLIRRSRAADPLVRKDKKKRPSRPPPDPENALNGTQNISDHRLIVPGQARPEAIPPHLSKPPPGIHEVSDTAISGFSSAPIAPYEDFPLMMSVRALKEEMRLHVARFASKKTIDPSNEDDFTRPVRLHRRDARAPPPGAKAEEELGDSKNDIADAKEREMQEIQRAQREAEREAEMAQVAPSVNKSNHKRLGAFKKKTEQVYRRGQTEDEKAQSKLKYEEALPWHLEDFDNKHTWVGSYEAALSETNAMLVKQDGVFRITPLEKWYKFTPKQKFKFMTTEQAETHMNMPVKGSRWFMDIERATKLKQDEKNSRGFNKNRGLFVGRAGKDDEVLGGIEEKVEGPADVDALDFDEDRFADDEENPLFEGEDDEAKEAESRIKKDQLQANIFDLKDEKTYDKEEILEKELDEAKRKFGKKTKKALTKREKNFIYDSESDHPYSEESESSDTESERLKEEERKKEEEKKSASQSDKEKLKVPKIATTKGTTAPSNRPGKPPNLSQRSSSSKSLKRSGSPNMSEVSGNESSRKKQKKQATSSKLQTGVSTTNGPPSRPRSPANQSPSDATTNRPATAQRKASTIRLNHDKMSDPSSRSEHKRVRATSTGVGGAGSGSDGEAISDGQTSDGTRKRIKLHVSKKTSLQVSRAANPDANTADATASKTGSRAASPAPRAATAASAPPSSSIDPLPLPSPTDLKAYIPPEGTSLNNLLDLFRPTIVNKEKKERFIKMLKTISRYNKETKTLHPI